MYYLFIFFHKISKLYWNYGEGRMLQAKLELVPRVPLQSVRKFKFRFLHKNTDSESQKCVIVSDSRWESKILLREYPPSQEPIILYTLRVIMLCFITGTLSSYNAVVSFFLHSSCKYFVWVPSILSKWSVHAHPTPSTPSLYFKCTQQYICICFSLSVTSSTLFWVVNVT